MPALAAAGPVECAKVIEAKVLEVPALANAMGPMKASTGRRSLILRHPA